MIRRALICLLVAVPLLGGSSAFAADAVAAPAKPVINSISRAAGQVTIGWADTSTPDTDRGTSFRVLRGPDATHLQLLATVPQLTYTDPDTADGMRVYAIESVNAVGTSPQSDPRDVDVATRAPGGFTGRSTVSRVELSWTAPTGFPTDPITGYAIFRGTSAGSLTQVATEPGTSWSGPAPAGGTHAFYQVAPIMQPGTLGPRTAVVDLTGVTSQLIVGTDGALTTLPVAGGPGTNVFTDGYAHPDVAVSPNGTQVAYTQADGDSNRNLWVRNADGTGEPIAIASGYAFDVYNPSWSLNGRQLAYARDGAGGTTICVTSVPVDPAVGNCSLPLSKGDVYDEPSWLTSNSVVATDLRGDSAPLVVLDVKGVAKPITGTAGGYTPVVSPDTSQVAYLAGEGADFTEVIKVVTLATGAVRTVPAPSGMLFSAPTWTRDMSALYVVGFDQTSSHLYRIGLAPGGTATTLTGIEDPWTVAVSTPDRVSPVNVKLGGIPAVTLNSTVTPTFSASDALNKIASYEVSFRYALYNGSYSGRNVKVLTRPTAFGISPGRSYCFSVVAVDRANNRSAATPEQCMVVPMDDRSLARSSGFAPVANRAYYAGTAMKATAKGQTLTRTGMTALRQLTVIASACPTCGVVDVFVGSAKVGSVNTVSKTTVNRKVFTLPAFSVRSGTVTLKVATSGKTVVIDGLGFRK